MALQVSCPLTVPAEFRRVDPAEFRDGVVDLFWRLRSWPWPNKEDCYRYWDWRYSSLSDDRPVVWVAIDGGKIVGHIALHPRQFRVNDLDINAGVPGNFLVDPEYRSTPIGPRLASSPRSMLRSGELEAVFAYGNKMAHAMFVRLGFRDIGAMQLFADVRRWGPALNRRFPGAAALAPLASAVHRLRKVARGVRPREGLDVFQARLLTADQTSQIDRSHWTYSRDALVATNSANYLANRYLRSPFRPRQLIAVFDQST
ncbi:MAG: GNAT family N-acetyltransferase, partial [Gemmatimonadaceae bacterium]